MILLARGIKMKTLVLFLFVAGAAALQINEDYEIRRGLPPARPPSARASVPTWGTITQKQDNFDANNLNTWQMRYIENGQWFKAGGPIFIMLGAEWTIDVGWLQSGQMFDMAEIHNAYMYYTEHRYFGQSFPNADLSTANLKYLSADQALADIAEFIRKMKADNANLANSKVVVFGGSYGATLSTWMRETYPDLVHAAVASSAPLLAKIDFHEYHDTVKTALGEDCAAVLMNASEDIVGLYKNGQNAKIEEDFSLCWPIAKDLDVQLLFSYIANSIGSKIQYADSNTVKDICTKLQNATLASDYDRLVAYSKTGGCRGNYDWSVKQSQNISLNNGNSRQWFYQTCTNFGFFLTSWGADKLYNFGISVDFSNNKCADVFGNPVNAQLTIDNVAATNLEHGGLNPDVTRVITVHGGIDPWHPLGVLEDINADSPTYVIPTSAHCQDMFSLDSWTSPEMHTAKQAVVDNVANWLQED